MKVWRKKLGILFILVTASFYVFALLYPFDWEWPRYLENGALRMPGGGYQFHDIGIAYSDMPPSWTATAIETHRVTIKMRVRSSKPRQFGPARIMTLSSNRAYGNLLISQGGHYLLVRVRTPLTDSIGHPGIFMRDVFASKAWVDITMTIEPGRLHVALGDGRTMTQDLPEAPLSNWDSAYRLALGNEFSFDRPWLGEIERLVVKAGDGDEVDYGTAAALQIPDNFWYFYRAPNLNLFQIFNLRDGIVNSLLFVPFGFIVGALIINRKKIYIWKSTFFIFCFSASLEIGQIFIRQRLPDVNDVILNTLGGGLGILWGRYLISWVSHQLLKKRGPAT